MEDVLKILWENVLLVLSTTIKVKEKKATL